MRLLHSTSLVLVLAACDAADPSLPPLLDPTESEAAATWLGDRATEADLAFRGEVRRVAYGHSTVTAPGEVELPFTFVTYRVLDGLTGGVPGEEITLRFLGGPVGVNIMMVSDLPLFDVGETDIVLVRDNGVAGCPLVDCADGRIRVVDDVLYTDDGHELVVDPSGGVVRGAQRDVRVAREHVVAGHVIRRDYSVDHERPVPAARVELGDVAGLFGTVTRPAAPFSVDPDRSFAVRM